MRLSQGVEWGIHSVTLLAFIPPGATLPASKLAEYHGLPEAYAAKHLQALSRAGIVESVPGARGGYRLARAPAEITFLDVVEAVDGQEAAFRCTEIRRRGPAGLPDDEYRAPCAINAAMLRADRAWRVEMERTTVADIVEGLVLGVHPEAARRSAEWMARALS